MALFGLSPRGRRPSLSCVARLVLRSLGVGGQSVVRNPTAIPGKAEAMPHGESRGSLPCTIAKIPSWEVSPFSNGLPTQGNVFSAKPGAGWTTKVIQLRSRMTFVVRFGLFRGRGACPSIRRWQWLRIPPDLSGPTPGIRGNRGRCPCRRGSEGKPYHLYTSVPVISDSLRLLPFGGTVSVFCVGHSAGRMSRSSSMRMRLDAISSV